MYLSQYERFGNTLQTRSLDGLVITLQMSTVA